MSRIFAVTTMLRMTSNMLLKKLFQRIGADVSGLDWSRLGKRDISPLRNFYNRLPPDVQDRADVLMYDIYELACDEGIRFIDECANAENQGFWSLWFKGKKGREVSNYSKASWAWIMFPDIFSGALEAYRASHRVWWRVREGLDKIIPDFGEGIRRALEDSIRNHFGERQCRGRYCCAKMDEYGDGIYYFRIEISDFASLHRVCTPENMGISREIRPLREIDYSYDSNLGTLRIMCSGSHGTKEELEDVFIRTVLNSVPVRPFPMRYDLAVMKSPRFSCVALQEDGVRISICQLVFRDFFERELSFSVPGKFGNVYMMIEDYLESERLEVSDVRVVSAKFRFEFLDRGPCRKGSHTFSIRENGGPDFRNQELERVEMIRKYLKKWGIEHERHTAGVLGAVG